MGVFRFKRFALSNERAAMRVGTDGVLLGAAVTLSGEERNILDVGTGTGCIALMIAQRLVGEIPGQAGNDVKKFRNNSEKVGDNIENPPHITGVDVDAPSVQEAADNFAASPWRGCLTALNVPLQEYTPEEDLDLIVSNPPYFDSSLTNPDERTTTARHSVSLSYRDIVEFASNHLTPTGRLAFILPIELQKDLIRYAAGYGLYLDRLLLIRTTPRKAPRRLIAEFTRSRPASSPEPITLTLQGPDGSRSEQYSELTKDFYLDK